MNKFLDEEIEEDEAFWNQDALQDVIFSYFAFGFCYITGIFI